MQSLVLHHRVLYFDLWWKIVIWLLLMMCTFCDDAITGIASSYKISKNRRYQRHRSKAQIKKSLCQTCQKDNKTKSKKEKKEETNINSKTDKKTTFKTNAWTIPTLIKTESDIRCSGRVSMACSACETCGIAHKLVIVGGKRNQLWRTLNV